MWKKIAIAGGTIALIGGIGTAALATSGSSSSSPSASASNSAGANKAQHRKVRALDRLKNFEHGSWVTRGKDNSNVTHTAFRGKASNVTPTSITVQSLDNTSQTFVVTGNTKVHTKAQHKGASIQAVQSGDTVIVSGTGTGPVTANQVLDTSR